MRLPRHPLSPLARAICGASVFLFLAGCATSLAPYGVNFGRPGEGNYRGGPGVALQPAGERHTHHCTVCGKKWKHADPECNAGDALEDPDHHHAPPEPVAP